MFTNKNFFFKLYKNSQKKNIIKFINLNYQKPFFYISNIFGSKKKNISCIMVIGYHPNNNNLLLVFDLNASFKDIFSLYQNSNNINYKIHDLLLLGMKVIYLNKSPMFFKYNSLSEKSCQRLKLNYMKYQKNFFLFFHNNAIKKWVISVFSNNYNLKIAKSKNIDLMLYDSFFNYKDKLLLNLLHKNFSRILEN
nr:hypothetical protein [Buchnera aphidicola]